MITANKRIIYEDSEDGLLLLPLDDFLTSFGNSTPFPMSGACSKKCFQIKLNLQNPIQLHKITLLMCHSLVQYKEAKPLAVQVKIGYKDARSLIKFHQMPKLEKLSNQPT